MKKNVGKFDKMGRLIFAVIIAALYFTGVISGTLGLVLGVVAVVMACTAVINFCPLYRILGVSTCCSKCQKPEGLE